MPAGTTRTIAARTLLRVTELERRDTPAWWAVTAPTPTEGTAGDTAATHTGGLTLNPDYAATNGTVTVFADTAAEAAVKGLSGTVTVALLGQTTDYIFGPDSVGTTAADHKPFLTVVSGSSVGVALEDMAGLAACDYDYNDRTWPGVTVAGAADPVVPLGGQDTWVWRNPVSNEGATVHLVVTEPDEATFRWRYTVTNDSLSTVVNSMGINQFELTPADTSLVTNMTTSLAGLRMGAIDGRLFWSAPIDVCTGPTIPIGSSGMFGFDTPPVPIAAATGLVTILATGVGGGGGGEPAAAIAFNASSSPEDPEEPHTCHTFTEDGAGGPTLGPGVPLRATVQSVTFSGDTNFPITADPGDPDYEAPPHYLDKNANGAIDQTGDHELPVGFVRHDQVNVSATFAVESIDPSVTSVYVRADGPTSYGGTRYDVPWELASVSNGLITLTETKLVSVLDDNVDYIPDFRFKWEISTSLGSPSIRTKAGESTNEMFVTLAASTLDADPMNVTPLWYFCQGAAGSKDYTESVDKAYKRFRGHNAMSHPDPDPLRMARIPSRPLHYYEEWDCANDSLKAMMESKNKDGTCLAFTELFKRDLASGGIPLAQFSKQLIRPISGKVNDGFLVKSWEPHGKGSATTPGYTFINEYKEPANIGKGRVIDTYAEKVGGVWKYKWGKIAEVTDLDGIAGQNSPDPLSIFGKHYVVKAGDTLYDPSYGTAFVGIVGGDISPWESACQQWETASLAAITTPELYKVNGVDRPRLAIQEVTKAQRSTIIEKAKNSSW